MTQAHVFIWELLMASQKNLSIVLEALARKEATIETTPQEILAIMGMDPRAQSFITFLLMKISLGTVLLIHGLYKSLFST